MNTWILIIIAAVIIVLLLRQKTRAQVVGICAVAVGLDAPSFTKWLRMGKKKRESKEKILGLLRERGELSNSDIREALGVSDRTAIRYMDELEKEGKVEQVGSTGRGVTYRLKP